MSCTTCGDSGIIYDYPSIMGRNITGRSVPGYDERTYGYDEGVIYEQNLPSQKTLSWDWGTFIAGVIVGGVLTTLLVTATGRSIGAAAGQRTAGYIRGR